MMIVANAAITILREMDAKNFQAFERDLKPEPLRYWCNAFPTELSKPHESGSVGFALYG